MKNRTAVILISLLILCVCCRAWGHSHTHIGRNQDQIWGTADDNKLWFFSMSGTPGWPNWGEPLELIYQQSGLLAGWYVCEELDCWHSAHPEHGNWQLGGYNSSITPDWQAGIERVSYTAGLITLDEDTLTAVMTNNGDKYIFDHLWMPNKYNENQTLGAWGFHAHMLFAVNGSGVGIGETFSATYIAIDEGSAGYISSEPYTLNFVTVPEPATFAFILSAAGFLRRRK